MFHCKEYNVKSSIWISSICSRICTEVAQLTIHIHITYKAYFTSNQANLLKIRGNTLICLKEILWKLVVELNGNILRGVGRRGIKLEVL